MVATPHQVRIIIENFVQALEPEICVERIILFGSYAHNQAHEWSDIDVAVLSPDFDGLTETAKTDLLARKTLRCHSRLMPLAYTPAQFDNAPPYFFAAEIRRTGKVIYDARRIQKGRKTAGKRKMSTHRRNGKTKAQAALNLPFDSRKLVALCRKNDVAMLGVFGSAARGETTPQSDIDLLVRFSRQKSLLSVADLAIQMEAAIDRKVDLLTEAAVNPYIRKRVERDLKVIYELR